MSTPMMPVPTTMPLEGRGLALFTVAVVMMCVSIMAVILRTFVRLYLVRAFGWDDTLMVFALGLFIFFAVTCIIGPEHGVGHKTEDFPSITMFETALKWWWLGQLFYILSSVVAKISIALALLRLAVRPIHRILLWSIIGVIIAFGLMFFFVLLLECNPISYFWMRFSTTAPGKCIAVDIILKIAYLYSSITIICDLTLGIFPIFLIWQLQMNSRTKLALAGILSLGAIASVAVIIRLPFLHHYEDTEFLYSTYQIAIWSVIETGIGITAGSLVTLRPLFRWFLDASVSYRRGYNTSGKRSSGRYPLSSLTGEGSKKSSQNPSHWRPDIDLEEPHNVVVTAVSSPTRQNHHLSDANSSQENLNPSPNSWDSRKHVNVHKTFVVTQEGPLT